MNSAPPPLKEAPTLVAPDDNGMEPPNVVSARVRRAVQFVRSALAIGATQPSTTRRTTRRWTGATGVAGLTLAIQSSMVLWAYRHQLIYGFGDSLSHMTIARRLWDSPNPGLSQLGTNWLPLPHLFYAVGSISTWAWRTGLGGSLFTVGCAVVTSVSLYRIGQRTGVGNAGGWLAAMIVATNPSWSYLSAVPMTEPFSGALTCLATAGLLRWSQSERPYSAGMTALFCGLPAAAGVLSRYEGWGFAATAGACVVWLSWRRFGWTATMRRQILAFSVLPAMAIAWWFIFNWGVYGNPLAFENGKFSSKSLVAPFASAGFLYGKGDLPAALALYGKDVLDVAGTAVAVAAIIGICVTVVKWRGLRQELWLCQLGIVALLVASIWQGQIYIRLPQMTPYGLFDTRVGTEALPFLAIAAAQSLRILPAGWSTLNRAKVERWLATLLLIVLSGGWVAGLANGSIPANAIAVLEARANANAKARLQQRDVATWLHRHATSGYILLDDTIFPIIPLIGFDLHRVIVTSSGATYRTLLKHPRLVTWVAAQVGNKHDAVWRTLHREGAFNTIFFPVVNFDGFVIYEQEPPEQRLPSNSLLTVPTHKGS